MRAEAEERVQLDEWSGPVSPRHQYKTRIVVARAPNGATLSYEHEGVYSGGKPTETRNATRTVPPEAYEALWAGLEERGVFSPEDAALPEVTRARVGISVNTLTAARGGRQARIEYTLASLKKPDGAKKRALIEHLQAWAEPLAAAEEPAAAKKPAMTSAAAKKPAMKRAGAETPPGSATKPEMKLAAAAKPPGSATKPEMKPAGAVKPAAATKKPAAKPAKKPLSR